MEYSAARLRRARKLYFNLIYKHIPPGIEGIELVESIAIKLQERGLYSVNTMTSDICFTIYKHMYRRDEDYMGSWYSWLAMYGYGQTPWLRKAA